MGFIASKPRRNGLGLENPTLALIVGNDAGHGIPKLRAVVHDPKVAELMGHHVVDHRWLEVNQSPIESDSPIRTGRSPASLRAAERQMGPLDLEWLSEMVQTLSEQAPSRLHEPGLGGVSDLIGQGMMGQTQVQMPLSAGVIRWTAERLIKSHPMQGGVQHDPQVLAQIGHQGTVGPVDGLRQPLFLGLLSL